MFVFLPFLMITLFYFGEKILADEKYLIINEIQITGGTGKSAEEFIELYNPTDSEINLKTLPLKLHTVNSKKSAYSDTNKKLDFIHETIPSKKYFLITSKAYAENKDAKGAADATYSDSLIADGALYISTSANDKTDIIDFVGLGANTYFNSNIIANPENTTAERIDLSNNWQESCVKGGTPGEKNSTKKDCTCPYSGKIKINELYTEKTIDFVEIKNISDEKIKIKNWSVSDSKYSPKIINDEKTLLPSEIYVFEDDFNLNVSNDTAKVFDENGFLVDFLTYGKTANSHSYAFDGTTWQWTSKITKGAENQFNELLSGKIKKDKTIYVGVYADFEARTDSKAKKFTWNFGDGHKSYLKKTRHKYAKTGTYSASLKITGEGEDTVLNFKVDVKKYDKAKVRIISLSPNPKGKDSENEWLEIWNNTKKKINLIGWSIATGWKNLYNHPVTKDFILKAGETKKLTRNLCAFSLSNKQAKVELRYPDGKVADKIKYSRENSILEDELYQKEKDNWQWTGGIRKGTKENQNDAKTKTPNELESIPTDSAPENKVDKKTGGTDFDLSDLGKYSENPVWRAKQKTQIALLFSKSNIDIEKFLTKNQGQVLGISTTKSSYQNTPTKKTHNQFWKKINAKLNRFILLFS